MLDTEEPLNIEESLSCYTWCDMGTRFLGLVRNAAFYDKQGVLRTHSNPDPYLNVTNYECHVQTEIL